MTSLGCHMISGFQRIMSERQQVHAESSQPSSPQQRWHIECSYPQIINQTTWKTHGESKGTWSTFMIIHGGSSIICFYNGCWTFLVEFSGAEGFSQLTRGSLLHKLWIGGCGLLTFSSIEMRLLLTSPCAVVALQLSSAGHVPWGLEGQKDREAWKTQAETEEVRGGRKTSDLSGSE